MDFLNKEVTHQKFGKGRVAELSETWVEICFAQGSKRFVFPDAFGTYLTLTDKKAAEAAKELKQRIMTERKKEEEEDRKSRALYQQERKRLLERNKKLSSLKIHPSSQVVFWCNKDEQSKVFHEWEIFAGVIQSGKSKGRIRKLSRLSRHSACLITARDSSMSESDRMITGIFMADDDFIGNQCEDGKISAHPEHRLQFSERESRKLLFWNYYVNERFPNRMTWNAGRYRYLDNIWVAQILKDVISLKQKSNDREKTQNFFQYFCELNHIKDDGIPDPNGVLKRR